MLKERNYALDTFLDRNGNLCYGIVNLSTATDPRRPYHRYQAFESAGGRRASNKIRHLNDLAIVLLSLGLLGVVLAYAYDYRSDGFNNFFSSDTFGPRFILSSAATLLDNRWRYLEREVRIMQPYRILFRHRDVRSTTKALFASTPSTPYTSFPIALRRGHLFQALVSFIAILGDVLIIVIVGVPFGFGQVYSSFVVSKWISITILSLMIATNLIVILWWRRGQPKGMPRRPDTILNVALYLCASGVTEDLVRLSMDGEKHGDRGWSALNGVYCFGPGLGVDEKERWLVDRDNSTHGAG
jgi:hypothetical protein